MVRPLASKGKKRKTPEERYNKEEEPKDNAEATTSSELDGIPIAPTDSNLGNKNPGVIFVLEKASLELAQVGKKLKLLSSDEDSEYLKKKKLNPADYRPDIAHQALLMILDSPLNKAGKLRAVYVKTQKGVLFRVNPTTRIPRTFKRFCGLISTLLQDLSVKASGTGEKLLHVIKNPVTQYLPFNSRKIGLSYSSEKIVKMKDYVALSSDDTDLVFVIGAMSHGKIEKDYVDDFVAVSNYQLSAAYCSAMICQALEEKFNIW